MEKKYPMITGLLLGVADSKEELIFDIFKLIQTCKENTSIQEVILQNFRAKQNTAMKNSSEIINDLFLRIIATTRIFLPSHISLQIPPNLVNDIDLFIKSGINDFRKPIAIKGNVTRLGMIKCSRSIKKMMMKPKLKTINNNVVHESANK